MVSLYWDSNDMLNWQNALSINVFYNSMKSQHSEN